MIELIESTVMSFVWLASEYLHGFEPHIAAGIIRRRFGTHGLFLHSIAQIVQLGIMTKEMEAEASFGCDDLVQPPSLRHE